MDISYDHDKSLDFSSLLKPHQNLKVLTIISPKDAGWVLSGMFIFGRWNMKYGYARVSTKGQAKDGNSLEHQEHALKDAGAEVIYMDAFTGTKSHRPELDKLLKDIQSGDMLIVTKLDRIARSTMQGIELIEALVDKGVIIHVLNIGIMDNSPTGKLIRNIFLAFAEFERDMIVERTQEGKSIAKQNPDFREGRPKKYSKAQVNHALELLNSYSYKKVAEMTGISVSSLQRAKRKLQNADTITEFP